MLRPLCGVFGFTAWDQPMDFSVAWRGVHESLCLTGLHSYISGAAAATVFSFLDVSAAVFYCLIPAACQSLSSQTVTAVFSALPMAVEVDH